MSKRQIFAAAATLTTSGAPGDIWALWVDVNGWPNWDQGLKAARSEGTFRPGTRLSITPQGGEPVELQLKSVTQGEEFCSEAVLPFGLIRTSHRMEPLGKWMKVTHEVHAEIEPDAVPFFAKNIWPHMQIGLSVSLNNIVSIVEAS